MTPSAAIGSICPKHTDRSAVGTCARCGRFMCTECRTSSGRCTDCGVKLDFPPHKPRAQLAVYGLYGCVAFDVINILISGARLGTGAVSDGEDLTAIGAAEGANGCLTAVIYIATVVVFLRWFHLVAHYAQGHGVIMDVTPGWAVGWWFIPFANLVKPYRVTESMVLGLGVTAPLGGWWACWIISNIASNIEARAALAGLQSGGLFALSIFSSLIGIGAALLCIQVIRAIEGGLEQREGAAQPA